MILASVCSLCFDLQAQQRMTISFEPSFDTPASIEVQFKQHQLLQIVFNQSGTHKPEESAFSWVQDTTSIVHVRKLGRYFQRFSFSDTISIKAEQSPILLKAFTEVYVNREKLSKLKDERLMLDGMSCSITISVNRQTQYLISYRPPVSTQTKPIDRLIREVLGALKMKSINPATVNYCMIVDHYME